MRNKVRVLMVSAQLGAGGAPRVILNISANFSPKVDIDIAYLGGKNDLAPEFEDRGFNVYQMGESPVSKSSLISLANHVRRQEYDLIHTHMMVGGVFGRVIGNLFNIPVVSTIHTSYDNRPLTARAPDLATCVLSDTNVCVSESVEKSLPSLYHRISNTRVIHNCIDIKSVREQGRTNWSDLGWTNNIEQESPVIANVARFDPKKRRKDLVKALPSIVEEYPDVSLVLTGKGPRKKQIRQLADELGVESNLFCVGFVENPQSVYHHADIILLPSISEGFSIGMLEAMAHGKPIVATDIPPFREALGEAHSLVSPYSPDEIASETLRILSDPSYSTQLGDRVFNKVSQMFSGAKAAKKYESVYSEFL